MTVPATAALINLDPDTAHTLEGCFSQFGIRSSLLNEEIEQRIQREKFDACVLSLNERAESILQAVRNSPSNHRIMIYGVARDSSDLLNFSKYGINIFLEIPVDRQTALKAIRASHLLVVHEHRRYVRIPVVIAVRGEVGARSLSATSREISAGEMSISSEELPRVDESLRVAFQLPSQSGELALNGAVCWVRETGHLFGIRFAEGESAREKVKAWIDECLGIA